ncbi:hypothetical protein L9F63_006766, partial [Diploptera punctata]
VLRKVSCFFFSYSVEVNVSDGLALIIQPQINFIKHLIFSGMAVHTTLDYLY